MLNIKIQWILKWSCSVVLAIQLVGCGGPSDLPNAGPEDPVIVDTRESTIIQEGDAQLCPFSGVIEQEHSGYTGAGYVNVVNASGSSLIWALNVPEAGEYEIAVSYANGSGDDRPASLSLGQQSKLLAFPSAVEWTTWAAEVITFQLAAGTQMLTLTATADSGLANIDSLKLIGSSVVGASMCPQQSPLTVWLAGDSTVANGQTPCPVGWGKTFAEFFNEKVTVQNFAAGGRSVRTWLYDITDVKGGDGECAVNKNADGSPVLQDRWQTVLDQMKAGDYLLIQFGINDGSATCPRHVGEGAFREEYAMMAKIALDRGAHPILLTPTPAIKCSGSTAVASRGFIDATFAVGNQLNIPVIDIHQLGTDLYNQLAFCPVPGGDVSAATGGAVGNFFCDDHTHFDTPGARMMGELITNALKSQYIALADFLK